MRFANHLILIVCSYPMTSGLINKSIIEDMWVLFNYFLLNGSYIGWCVVLVRIKEQMS
jgi:hypothetical protein